MSKKASRMVELINGPTPEFTAGVALACGMIGLRLTRMEEAMDTDGNLVTDSSEIISGLLRDINTHLGHMAHCEECMKLIADGIRRYEEEDIHEAVEAGDFH